MVIGVSFDTVEENSKFADKFNFPFLLLSDTEKKVGVLYGACQSPTDKYANRIGYVIDAKGRVKYANSKVDAKSFPESVLAEL